MLITRFRARQRAKSVAPAMLVAAAIVCVSAVPSSPLQAQALITYSIDWHYISAAGHPVRNNCFILSGTAGQPAPGYSSSSGAGIAYSVLAGFWSGAPTSGLDEIFFNGFEGC